VGARDENGRLVATGRANSDGARHAYVADVAVMKELRGRGLGAALVRLLLEHPRVRGAEFVRLGTVDAQPFYERFGFEAEEQVELPFPVARLLLRRATQQSGEVKTHSVPQLAPGAA